jgi:hypothetical protein
MSSRGSRQAEAEHVHLATEPTAYGLGLHDAREAQAFRESRCFMSLGDGRQIALTVVAYTRGDNRAFVEAQAA